MLLVKNTILPSIKQLKTRNRAAARNQKAQATYTWPAVSTVCTQEETESGSCQRGIGSTTTYAAMLDTEQHTQLLLLRVQNR